MPVASDFVVTLDHSSGSPFGVTLTSHRIGIHVEQVRPGGLFDAWNATRDDTVQAGDWILSVNGLARDGNRMLEEMARRRVCELRVRKSTYAVSECRSSGAEFLVEDLVLTPKPGSDSQASTCEELSDGGHEDPSEDRTVQCRNLRSRYPDISQLAVIEALRRSNFHGGQAERLLLVVQGEDLPVQCRNLQQRFPHLDQPSILAALAEADFHGGRAERLLLESQLDASPVQHRNLGRRYPELDRCRIVEALAQTGYHAGHAEGLLLRERAMSKTACATTHSVSVFRF